MKVQFWKDPAMGETLTVAAGDFLKCENNQDEYTSLSMAFSAFYALFNWQYSFTPPIYGAIRDSLNQAGKSANVVFALRFYNTWESPVPVFYIYESGVHREVQI